MNIHFDDLKTQLKNKNIRISHQRLKVYEYIYKYKNHPTVDDIYTHLHKEIPCLSRTTIYNTLNALVEVNLVKVINIDDNESRYDMVTEDHGHFKCECCGNIYDFQIDKNIFNSNDLNEFNIKHKDIYFKGTCPKCTM